MENRCYLCGKEESTYHLLVHCDMACAVWRLSFSLFGVHWVLLFKVRGVLLSWHESFTRRKKKCGELLLCLFGMVWGEQDRKAFNNKENSIHRIKLNFLCNLRAWSSVFLSQAPTSFVDFVNWIGTSWGAMVVLGFGWLFSFLLCFLFFV